MIKGGVTRRMSFGALAVPAFPRLEEAVAAAHAGINFRATFSEAIADFAAGQYFTCAETGELRLYRRTAWPPFYDDQGDAAAPLTRPRLAAPADGDQFIGSDDGAGGALWTTVKGFIARLLSSAGATLVGFAIAPEAKARPVEEKLREIEVNVNDFGAVPNDIGQAAANYAAIRAALAHCLSQSSGNRLEGHPTLTFASGEYFISGNSCLMFNHTEMQALPGSYRYRRGLRVRGAGRHSTILSLVSSGRGDQWFYDTYDRNTPDDTSVADYIAYEGITFRGVLADGEQTSATLPAGSKTSGFRWKSQGFEKFNSFVNCTFESLCENFRIEGYGNVDHNRWYNCQFRKTRDLCFHFNNNQSAANSFFGCDMEEIHGRCFEIGPQGGGDVFWASGSILLFPETDDADTPLPTQRQKGFVHWDNSGVGAGPSSGQGNSKFTFQSLRFETYSGSQPLVCSRRREATGYGNLDVTFRDCTMSQVFDYVTKQAPSAPYVTVDVENRTVVTFDRCTLGYSSRFRLRRHDPVLSFHDCEYLAETPLADTNLLRGKCSVESGAGAIVARGTISQRNRIQGDYSQLIVADFNIGRQTYASPTFSAQGKDVTRGWPQPAAMENCRTYLPEGTIVHGVIIDKPAESVGSPTPDYAMMLMDSGGRVLFATTPQNQNLAVLEKAILTRPHRIPAAPQNYVELSATGAPVTTPFAKTEGGVIFDLV
jgi:hypothetical protein